MAVWTDLSGVFGTQEQLTSTQQQQLRDNTTAAFEKAAGAPQLATDYIVNAMVSSDSIQSTQVKNSDATVPSIGSGQDTSSGSGIKEPHIQDNAIITDKLAGDVIAYMWMFQEI